VLDLAAPARRQGADARPPQVGSRASGWPGGTEELPRGRLALQLAGAVLLTLDLPPALGLLDDAAGGVVGPLCWRRGAWETRCWLVAGAGLDAVSSGLC
jgi:hypothetical protein